MDTAALDALATLLSYPSGHFEESVRWAQECVSHESGSIAERLAPIAQLVAGGDLAVVEELFTRTFDMNPSCALEAGWHLYGEDYDRGAFLVHLRGQMRSVGVEESGELPDHMSHVLRLLGRLPEDEAGAMARSQILPALARLMSGFSDGENPYRAIVAATVDLLTARFGPADDVPASAFACPEPYERQGDDFICPGMTSPHHE